MLECCDGYERGADGSTCLPVCSDTCQHGTWVGPDTCQCEQGFGGKDCSKCKNEDNYCSVNVVKDLKCFPFQFFAIL